MILDQYGNPMNRKPGLLMPSPRYVCAMRTNQGLGSGVSAGTGAPPEKKEASGGGGGGYGVQWTDDFNRADNLSLGSPWEEDSSHDHWRILSNKLHRPGGGTYRSKAWLNTGDGVVVGKNKMRFDLVGVTAQQSTDRLQWGFCSTTIRYDDASNDGYYARNISDDIQIYRILGGAKTFIVSFNEVGIDTSPAIDVALEIELTAATEVTFRLFKNNVQFGSDFAESDATDARDIFTTAYPFINSNDFAASPTEIDEVSVTY